MHKADHARRRTKEVAAVDGVLGIDIAKAKFEVALLRPDGKIRRKSCANTPEGFADLARWLARQAVTRVHAALEATGTFGEALAESLHDAGHVVSVLNPAITHAFAASQLKRAKTDRIDAALIAQYTATQHPPAWTPAPREVRELQALIRRLDALLGMRTQEANRLAAGISVEAVQTSITTVLTTLDAEITAVQQQIRGHVGRHPGLRAQRDLLTSIPGIGEATAAVLIAELFDQPYTSARQAAAFAGLVPRIAESGTGRTRGRLVKRGPGRLRKALYFPALAALRCNPTLRALRLRMRAAGKPPMVIVGAAMRKLIHLAFGVLKSGRAYDPTYAQP
jgi:transposase